MKTTVLQRVSFVLQLAAACTIGAGTARSALIAYEPFATSGAGAYTTGAINGQNPSVTGFTGAWANNQNPAASATVSATGLTYPGLPTSGGMYVARNTRSFRGISPAFDNTTNGTYWMSYLYQSVANGGNWQAWEIFNSPPGTPGKDDSRVYLIANGAAGWPSNGNFSVNASTTLVASNTNVNLFVIKMDFVAGGSDTFTAWMNPSLGSEPTGGLAVTGDLSWNYFDVFTDTAPADTNFDELRIGTTYADVVGVPEPSAAILLGVGFVSLVGFIGRRRQTGV